MLLYLLICVLMLGIDELACQLEQPFSAMPTLDLAQSTLADICLVQQQAATLDALGRAAAAAAAGQELPAAGALHVC